MPTESQHFLKQLAKFPLIVFFCCLCLLITSCGETSEETYQRLNRAAHEHFSKREYQNALESWTKIIDLQPVPAEIYKKIGECYLNLASYHDALRAFQTALQQQPEAWDIWLEVAKIQLSLINFDAAEQSWEIFHSHITNKEALIFMVIFLLLKKSILRHYRNIELY